MIAIEKGKYTQIEKELLGEIDAFKRKKSLSSINIKRNEIEKWIEIVANSLSIEYKKELNPTYTVYFLYIENMQLQMKVFFRYGTYYTRHQMID